MPVHRSGDTGPPGPCGRQPPSVGGTTKKVFEQDRTQAKSLYLALQKSLEQRIDDAQEAQLAPFGAMTLAIRRLVLGIDFARLSHSREGDEDCFHISDAYL